MLERTELVSIQSKENVFEREQPIRFAHFPDDCVISLVTKLDNGDAVEAMTVGNDGFVGLAIFHGLPSSRLTAVGQISGASRRVRAEDFRELMAVCPDLHALLHRYSQSQLGPGNPWLSQPRSSISPSVSRTAVRSVSRASPLGSAQRPR